MFPSAEQLMHIRSILFVLTLWSVACGDGACAVAADEQTDVPETVRRKRERARQVRSLLESRGLGRLC